MFVPSYILSIEVNKNIQNKDDNYLLFNKENGQKSFQNKSISISNNISESYKKGDTKNSNTELIENTVPHNDKLNEQKTSKIDNSNQNYKNLNGNSNLTNNQMGFSGNSNKDSNAVFENEINGSSDNSLTGKFNSDNLIKNDNNAKISTNNQEMNRKNDNLVPFNNNKRHNVF